MVRFLYEIKTRHLRVASGERCMQKKITYFFSAFFVQDFFGAAFLVSFLTSLSCCSRRSISFS